MEDTGFLLAQILLQPWKELATQHAHLPPGPETSTPSALNLFCLREEYK